MRKNNGASVLLAGSPDRADAVGQVLARRTEIRSIVQAAAGELLDLAQRQQPSVIAIAVDHPGHEVLDVCADLRELPMTDDIPIVLVGPPPVVGRAAELGIETVVFEPYTTQELLRAVGGFVALHLRKHPRFPVNLRFAFQGTGNAVRRSQG